MKNLKALESRVFYENKFCELLKREGINFVTGVPCGVQKYIIKNFMNSKKIIHIPALRESEAIGLAAGAWLSGLKPTIYMQNSGFFNSINDITSLLLAYKIPVIMIVSWRGAPGEDAPQHFINGRNTKPLLRLLKIPYYTLTKTNLEVVVKKCVKNLGNNKCSVILIKRGELS